MVPRLLAVLGLVTLAPGCGLISSDLDDFRLSLPEKEFAVDTAAWGMSGQLETAPTVPCSDSTPCAAAAGALCTQGECAGTCGGAGTCEVRADVSLYQGVNMAAEKPELEDIDRQQGLRVTIESIEFTIDENTLNVASPVLELWAAPASVLEPGATAQLFGHIASLPPGSRTTAQVEFIAGGEAIISSYLSDYRTPFNLIVAGEVVVEAGAPVPQGRVAGRITGTATADAI